MKYVTCNRCGNKVSNTTTEDIIVRAYIECPDCIGKTLATAVITNDPAATKYVKESSDIHQHHG